MESIQSIPQAGSSPLDIKGSRPTGFCETILCEWTYCGAGSWSKDIKEGNKCLLIPG